VHRLWARLAAGDLETRIAAHEVAVSETEALSEPRKLLGLVWTTLKQGWIKARGSDAQTASEVTCTVPDGSAMWRGSPPLTCMVPITDPSA